MSTQVAFGWVDGVGALPGGALGPPFQGEVSAGADLGSWALLMAVLSVLVLLARLIPSPNPNRLFEACCTGSLGTWKKVRLTFFFTPEESETTRGWAVMGRAQRARGGGTGSRPCTQPWG